MDYKEKYEQALERARQFSEKPYLEDSAGIVEYIFPELAESEDEKVRKDIVFYIAAHHKDDGEKARWLAWLEKQGEQKQEWSEEDENMRGNLLGYLNGFSVSETAKHQMFDWLKSIRPQPQWKPSDEKLNALWATYNKCLSAENDSVIMVGKVLESLYKELKRL